MNIATRFAFATFLVVFFGLSQFVLLYLLIEGHKKIELAYEDRFE